MKKVDKKIVLVTGGFDPIHSGHIKLFNKASILGDKLIVGINSDDWLIRKKGYFFQNLNERKIIISNLSVVNDTISWDDSDDTAIGAINLLIKKLENYTKIIFANGGDRVKNNTPELLHFLNNTKLEFKFGIGGYKKINSSSKIVSDIIKDNKT